MYEKKKSIKTSERCNYTVSISPKDSSIFFSQNEQGFILPKEKFISLTEEELIKLKDNKENFHINSEDTIATSKYSSTGEFLIIGDQSKSITKYNLSEGNTSNSFVNVNNLKSWKFDISTDDKTLVTGCSNIFIYELDNNSNNNKLIKEIENRTKFIYSFCFIPNNKIAVGNVNGSINLFNINTYEQENKIEEHCLLVRNMSFNKNKNILYTASDDLHINQIDINTLKLISPIIGHKEPISGMIYNDIKEILITSSFDGTIKIWDTKKNNSCIQTLELENKLPIWDIGVSKEADFIAYCTNEEIGTFLLK